MTAAICIECGGYKDGPFAHCPHCNFIPRSGPDLLLSYAASAATLTPGKFHACALDIKNGLRPRLTPQEVWQLAPFISRCADLAGGTSESTAHAQGFHPPEGSGYSSGLVPTEMEGEDGPLRSELIDCRRCILEIEHELVGTQVQDASGSSKCDLRALEARLGSIQSRLLTVEHRTRAWMQSDLRVLRQYLAALTEFTEATRQLCQILAEIEDGAWYLPLTVAKVRRKRKACKKDFMEAEPLLDTLEHHSIALRLRPSFPS